MACPIGLDKIHCQNCYFWGADGECHHEILIKGETHSEEAILDILAAVVIPKLTRLLGWW